MKSPMLRLLAPMLTALLFCTTAQAQATRTWVSGVGDDANPCSRTAPCKTFAGAISKTAAGGEINAIDPGGYGAVTITKAITINGHGTLASVLVSGGTNGIIVNAGAGDVVTLRGLSMTGTLNALNAIRYLAAKYLVVEDVTIDGFANGINMATSVVNGRMDIRNVRMTSAGSSGIGTGSGVGIHVGAPGSIVTITNVSVRGYEWGIYNRGGEVYMRGSTVSNNAFGYLFESGNLFSFGDNMVSGNGVNGMPQGLATRF